jgi:transposase
MVHDPASARARPMSYELLQSALHHTCAQREWGCAGRGFVRFAKRDRRSSWSTTHKHPKVRQWLARHPRWTFHFTPTSASWLNDVEGFFAKLTKRRLKRGVFVSVVDLQETINRFVVEHNSEPKPFTWTADPNKIIRAVRRGHQVLDSIH